MQHLIYTPKGGMCVSCLYVNGDCSGLDFSAMLAISKPDENNVVVVKCSDYKNRNDKEV